VVQDPERLEEKRQNRSNCAQIRFQNDLGIHEAFNTQGEGRQGG
jgi:hypothetical protein